MGTDIESVLEDAEALMAHIKYLNELVYISKATNAERFTGNTIEKFESFRSKHMSKTTDKGDKK